MNDSTTNARTDEDKVPEACQRCHHTGYDRRMLYMQSGGTDEVDLPFRIHPPEDFPEHGGLRLRSLLLCDHCLEDWWGALAYWWIRIPGHELDERDRAWHEQRIAEQGFGVAMIPPGYVLAPDEDTDDIRFVRVPEQSEP